MFGLSSKLRAKRRAWRLAVGTAAGLTIRDHGDDAWAVARALADEAVAHDQLQGQRFWTAVAAEILVRGGEASSEPDDRSIH